MNRAIMAASASKLLRFFPTPSTATPHRALLHLSTENPSLLPIIRLDDGDDPSSPVSQIVELLKDQTSGGLETETRLRHILSKSLSVRHFLQIGRRLPSADAALNFVRHLDSEHYRLEPGSLSAVFQAAFEIAGRERRSSNELWRLVLCSKEMDVPISINAATFLLRRFRNHIDRSKAVYDAVEPGSRNVYVRNLLLDVIFTCGSAEDALKLLDGMLEPNSDFPANDETVVFVSDWIWSALKRRNRMDTVEIVKLLSRLGDRGLFISSIRLSLFITAFSSKGGYDAAWDLLHCYLKLGGPVNVNSYNSLLSASAKKGKLSRMSLLLKEMKDNGIAPNVMTIGIFIQQLCKSGRIDDCLELLKKMKEKGADWDPIEPDAAIYNMIINGLCRLGRHKDALALVEKMKLDGHCRPNAVTYGCLMDSFCKIGEVNKSLELFDVMKSEGVKPSVVTMNILVDGLCKNARVNSAVKIFEEMKGMGLDGDQRVYTSLISAFCGAGNVNKAMQLIDEMEGKCKPDAILYYAMILGFCRVGQVDDASNIMSLMKEAGFQADIGCYNTMIGALCKKKKLDRVAELLKEMELNGIKPDAVTYNSLISFYSKSGDFETALSILKKMREEGIIPSVTTYGALIHAYCVAGDLDEAMNIFKLMNSGGPVKPNNIIYNILIEALCKNEKVEAALSLFDDLIIKELKPNANTFNTLFRGLKEVGWLEKAFELMDMMISQGTDPNYITMGILTEWLSNVGETDRLRTFARSFQGSGLQAGADVSGLLSPKTFKPISG